MPAYMGRDLWHLHFIDAVVLLTNMLEVFLLMQGYHRHIIFIQIQESAFAIYHRLGFHFLSVCDDSLKTLIYLVGHGYFSHAACGLCVLNHILHISFSL